MIDPIWKYYMRGRAEFWGSEGRRQPGGRDGGCRRDSITYKGIETQKDWVIQ